MGSSAPSRGDSPCQGSLLRAVLLPLCNLAPAREKDADSRLALRHQGRLGPHTSEPVPRWQLTHWPGRRSDGRRGSPWETRNIACRSLPQRQTEGRLLLQVSTGSPGSYFWFPGKGHCCLFIYRLYFWMGVGKRLFLVGWWVVLCEELKS